jgi:hypothetical protein
MADQNKKSSNLLPAYFRSDKNLKFLSSTIDQLIEPPQLERINGYVGSKITANYKPATDLYIQESLPLRANYQLEPGLVFKDSVSNITDVVGFDDLINEIGIESGKNNNLDRIFRTNYYSYDPHIDWDKFVNFDQYYWLPNGPDSIVIDLPNFDVDGVIIGRSSYTMPNGHRLSNGMKLEFTSPLIAGYAHKQFIVEGVGSSISLIDFDLLSVNGLLATIYNERFDSDKFDDYPFDSDAFIAENPEYVTINRASRDLNSWSRYNRWVHRGVIQTTALINKTVADYAVDRRAKRPIIEFKPNIQLCNHGEKGIKNIDLMDQVTLDAFDTVEGAVGYYIDGVLVTHGQRVVFNNDINDTVRGNVYRVNYTNPSDDTSPIIYLTLVDDPDPGHLDSVSVNYGKTFGGKSFHYDTSSKTWVYSQQHTTINQAPLFDLFDKNETSYYDQPNNSFTGNKIFGYEIGTGAVDSVLKISLKQNQYGIGIGGYLFKNYFLSDTFSIVNGNVSTDKLTASTLLKINTKTSPKFVNVWTLAENYPIPVIETQTVNESTTTIIATCFNKPIQTPTLVELFVNNVKINSSSTVVADVLSVESDSTLNVNDSVVLKITTNQVPNSNGYYETPLSLTNNPFNELIDSISFSELTDHFSTMVNRLSEIQGVLPDLRDRDGYAGYGSRLIISDNPIAFAQMFLGKKEHNVVDSIKFVGDQYNQFKLNLLKFLEYVNDPLDPVGSLNEVLKRINQAKAEQSLFYASDMLGYGDDKTIRQHTVSNTATVQYSIGTSFDISQISYQSVLVYVNGIQLAIEKDYNLFADSVLFLNPLALNSKITIHVYGNTLGSFIPPTPSKLGLYPKFVPEIYNDNRYAGNSVRMIRGHDGSQMVAYNDYRDNIILEFERRVYNNIKTNYNPNIFNIDSVSPGAFRTKYTRSEINDLLRPDYIKWAGSYNVDINLNDSYDSTNYRTWNYQGTTDLLLKNPGFGTWKALFNYFYDTDRPHTHPWEMLGYTEKPAGWDLNYSWTDPAKRSALINVITLGSLTNFPGSIYARPGFNLIVPVDTSGNLRDPSTFLVTTAGGTDQLANWVFGDYSPAETAWRNSSLYPFSLNAAAALLFPCEYVSRLYDTSRIHINSLNQIEYTNDGLYLDPRKLLVDGVDNNQITGFGNFVIEHGFWKYKNYREKLTQDLDFLNSNLFYKLGGFASKEKLQIQIDSINPNSSSPGAVLPPEDYALILNVSNPIKSVGISGVVVQKRNGRFVLKGYDRVNPYFEIFRPIKTVTSTPIVVGGRAEPYVNWIPVSNVETTGLTSIDIATATGRATKFYKQGQVVFYNGKYYRVKTSHNAQSSFDKNLFQLLLEQPIKGGARVELSPRFETTSMQIPYGSEFSTVQEVYDVLIGYGEWLERQGFIFDQYNGDLVSVMDWKFSGKEFLYWSTQNWADGNLITLSPFADYLKYQYADSVVENIYSKDYDYSLQNANGQTFPVEGIDISRQDGYCVIQTKNTQEGIFFARLNSVQKEHGMIFNNSTMFNDIIYDPVSGYRQKRIKLYGFRTKGWNGDLTSPGFVYDSVSIVDWEPYKEYLPGQLVRYNSSFYESKQKTAGSLTFDFTKWVKLSNKPESQLLSNFDYRINQFEDFYSLDIDNFDSSQQKLAQHLIGYTPRTYLNNIFTDSISQYKFYQGFIREKGTKNAVDRLTKASQNNKLGSVEINEEWAFRLGHYGGFTTYNEIEFSLHEGTYLENPYIVKFSNVSPKDALSLVHYVTPSDLLLTPNNYQSTATFFSVDGTFDNNNLDLIHAGYVRLDDITATAYNKNSLLDIANNSLLQDGNTIWLGFLENGDWSVYRYRDQEARIAGVYVSSPGTEITFVTDIHHNLQVGDIVSVVRFNEQVNGIYIVTAVPMLSQFTVASTLAGIVNEPLLSYGSLFKFESARYSNFQELSQQINLLSLAEGANTWIDNDDNNRWAVYQKTKNFSTGTSFGSHLNGPVGQYFGRAIYAAHNSKVVLVSAPGSTTVSVYYKNKNTDTIDKQFEYTLNYGKTYCDPTSYSGFGYSLNYDIGKELYFFGAPFARSIRATTSVSTTPTLSLGTGLARSAVNEGLIKIGKRDGIRAKESSTATVLVQSIAFNGQNLNNSLFGHSIYINQVPATTSTMLVVGAPGNDFSTGIGTVYAYLVDKDADISNHPSGVNVVSTSTTKLKSGSKWGYKIAGDTVGSVIAISAPGYFVDTGVVQIFNSNLTWTQNLTSPFDQYGKFGFNIAVSSSGKFIAVSAVGAGSDIESYGRVAIYSVDDNKQYVLRQIISNPAINTDLKFGYALGFSNDESTLVISSLGTNKSKGTRFFDNVNHQYEETIFDGNETKFISAFPDSGAAYVYSNLGNFFILADELNNAEIMANSKYGISLALTNNSIFVGASSTNRTPRDISKFYQFKKKDTSINSWKLLRNQDSLVDSNSLQRVALIDSFKEELIDYLDVIDPLKGKIAGIAEQELTYKLAADPAVYSIGLAGTNNDTETNWLDEHVGELWWDLSTAKYVWYEQGNEIFRKNNWGKLFPGASIDVYEWVRSDMLPSEWAAAADTTEGLTKGISGQPKYPDNSIISVKQLFNNVTNSFENVYYFWVKNKVIVPGNKNRRLSGFQVASIINDPIANGIKFVEILSANSVAFANVLPMLVGDRISANIVIDKNRGNIPRHTEWVLLEEGSSINMPPALLEKKLIDSLVGRDSRGITVPAENLTFRNRYGIGIRPQQTLFKDRFEALRNLIEFVNSVLLKNRITEENYNFENLSKAEDKPTDYDIVLYDEPLPNQLDTLQYKQAQLTCTISNGKLRSVSIIDAGSGYINAPGVSIMSDNSGAEIVTTIDDLGRVISAKIIDSGDNFVKAPVLTVRPHTALVEEDRWSIWVFNYDIDRTWTKIRTQLYDTRLFWKQVDWVSDTFDQYREIKYGIGGTFELPQLIDVQSGDYVKVKNSGLGFYIILEKTSNGAQGNFSGQYNIVYSENGTIQILDSIWNYNIGKYAYDSKPLSETLYDQVPDLELFNILTALKENIFVNDLKVNWNLFFFKAVKYALTEQKLLDWAFKTSFVSVKNNTDVLDQRSVYKLDRNQYFENYINEIKPYHTKIRNFITGYSGLENANLSSTDFDLPSYYDTNTEQFKSVTLNSDLIDQSPWNTWKENYKYNVVDIIIADPGKKYSEQPIITITGGGFGVTSTATAVAYIRNSGIYKILVTNPGQGYTETPSVTITGGGPLVTSTATASAILGNDTIRKNLIGMKFDRVSINNEIRNVQVTESFTCNGVSTEINLSWMANPDKLTITPYLDGRLILASDYRIVNYSKNASDHSKRHSKFVFLNTVPSAGQVFRITYNKNINLFKAVDRINNYYTATDTLASLMSGVEYPKKMLQGLKFDYSTPLAPGDNSYDKGGWDDFVNYYTKVKLVSTASVNSTVLYLNTTTGIVPGQVINFLDSPDLRVRTDTVVVSVNTATRSIEISAPVFEIKSAKSTATSIGSIIRITTKKEFRGDLREGDTVLIAGITTGGYSDEYTIDKIYRNDLFGVKAKQVLSNKTASFTTATVRAYSILSPVNSHNKVLGSISFQAGYCPVLPLYSLSANVSRIDESGTVVFTIDGTNVDFGRTGRIFQYSISGTGITAGDFVDGKLTDVLTTTTFLPITFSKVIANNVDSPDQVESFVVNLSTWLASSSTNNTSVASTSVSITTGTARTYTLTAKDLDGNIITSVNEGGYVQINLNTNDLEAGSLVPYTITGANITASDLGVSSLTGNFVINTVGTSSYATLDLNIAVDELVEGTETFTITLNGIAPTISTSVAINDIVRVEYFYDTPGTYSLTAPAGYRYATATLVGAGGGGGGHFQTSRSRDKHAGGGGGGGAYTLNYLDLNNISGNLTITVGAGGIPASCYYDPQLLQGSNYYRTGTKDGANGGATSISWVAGGTTYLSSAGGGIGGIGNTNDDKNGRSGAGGITSGGSTQSSNGRPGGIIDFNRDRYSRTQGGVGWGVYPGSGGLSFSYGDGGSSQTDQFFSNLDYDLPTAGTSGCVKILLTNIAPNIGPIASNFGQSDSSLVSVNDNGQTQQASVQILSTGKFNLAANVIDVYPTPADNQSWFGNRLIGSTAVNGANYYVRATVTPLGTWLGNATFTGSGFNTNINVASLNSNGYLPVVGNWIQVSTAEYGYWGLIGQYGANNTSDDAVGDLLLFIEISSTSGGTVLASGTYRLTIKSSNPVFDWYLPGPDTGDGTGDGE